MTAEEELAEGEEAAGPLFEKESTDIVEVLIHWFPAFLFFISLIILISTVVMNPWKDRKRSRPAVEYYEAAIRAVNPVRAPGASFDEASRRRQLSVALVNLNRLLFHFPGKLDDASMMMDPIEKLKLQYVNPYLVLAETYRWLEPITIPERREAFLENARTMYTNALQFEHRRRGDAEQARWDQQFRLKEEGGLPQEISVRSERRKRYIRYFRAVTNLRQGRHQLAMSELKSLGEIFFREEMDALRQEKDGYVGMTPEEEVPLADYELLREDKVKLHFYLGQLYMVNNEIEEAEKEYRLFLLQAPRSREAFQARMRLGVIQYERGILLRKEAQLLLGQDKYANLEKARLFLQSAADAFSGVVNASPQEDLLREAYFLGGMCKLAYSQTMDVGRETWWDISSREGNKLQQILERFSGASLPARTLALPDVIGHTLLQDAGGTVGGYGGVLPALIGSGMVLAMKARVTPMDEREQLLLQARSFFDAASSDNPGGHSEGECRVMIGRSLLAEGRIQDARRIFTHALGTYSDPRVLAGARFGAGQSHQAMNEHEEAWKLYSSLPSGKELVDSALLSQHEIVEALRQLAQAYIAQAEKYQFLPAWGRSAPGSPNWLSAMKQAENQSENLTRATQVFERMVNQYSLVDQEVSLRIAALYAQRAHLLKNPPMGSTRDLSESRALFFSAADQYSKTAAQSPGSAFSEGALEQAGEIYMSLGAYQQASEVLRLFERRHERSQRIAFIRNRLGFAYLRLAMFPDATAVFRANAEDTNVSEGRKSLLNLGMTYHQWGPAHWGLPEFPPELLTEEEKKSARPLPADPSIFQVEDIIDWKGFLQKLRGAKVVTGLYPVGRILDMLGEGFVQRVQAMDPKAEIRPEAQAWVVQSMNALLAKHGLYDPAYWRETKLNDEVETLLRMGREKLKPRQLTRLNRLLMEGAFPGEIVRSFGGKSMSTIPDNALDVFEYIRRLPGHGPESIPWRNSTFELGYVLYDIADHLSGMARQTENVSEARRNWNQENTLEYFHRSAGVLQEGLARYRVFPQHEEGYRQEEEPDIYAAVIRYRFRSSYLLANALRRQGRRGESIELFRSLLDDRQFPEEVVLVEENAADRLLPHYRRNAYIFLGILLFESEEYEEAYQIFETANDRLDPADSPYLLYRMGECMRALGRMTEARTRYIQAQNLSQNAAKVADGGFEEFGVQYWSEINAQRIKDLEYLDRMAGVKEQ